MKADQRFMSDLHILLNGYLNMGRSIEGMVREQQDQLDLSENLEMKRALKFFSNGYKFGKRFLGRAHPITDKFLSQARAIIDEKSKGSDSSRHMSSNDLISVQTMRDHLDKS